MIIREFQHQGIEVLVFDQVRSLAQRAATDAALELSQLQQKLQEINVILAGAQSQMEFHKYLARQKEIDWSKINTFAVDDFWCPGMPASCRVSAQPRRDLYSAVTPRSVNFIDPDAADPEIERARYEALIASHPPDLACVGIGVSGHLALCEPGAADFNDPCKVRMAELCQDSKRQLEQDPNFNSMEQIPSQGITCTIPTILSARHLMVLVPYKIKAAAIRRFFTTDPTPAEPSTALKTRPGTRLYLDAESFGECQDLAF
jgi:glucosamine-6-phosphate deaminase